MTKKMLILTRNELHECHIKTCGKTEMNTHTHTVASDWEWRKAVAHTFKVYTITYKTVSGINNTAYVK
jgi:hypothetical protein